MSSPKALPHHGGHPAGASIICARPGCAVRPTRARGCPSPSSSGSTRRRPRAPSWPIRSRSPTSSCSSSSRPPSVPSSSSMTCSTTASTRSPPSSIAARPAAVRSRCARGAASSPSVPRFERRSATSARGSREQFLTAFREGDIDELLHLVADEAVFVGDGGGKAAALPEPIHGRDRVVAPPARVRQPEPATASAPSSRRWSTPSPAPSSAIPTAWSSPCSPSTSSTARSRRSARSSTRTRSPTSARSAR